MKKMSYSILLVLASLSVILASCASSSPVSSSPGTIGDITLADNGKTIHMIVGQSFLLKLGEYYDWNISISDQNVISRVKNIAVIRGAQGVYDALAKGTVVLSAVGDPTCRSATPACASPSIEFSVTISVK
jgi:hypothetical protein